MGENSSIEWTDHTWNPWMGCAHVSSGCANCYMFTDMRRYGRDPDVVTRTKTWRDPPKWNRKASKAYHDHYQNHYLTRWVRPRVFTCSWSDFFIEEADQWRDEAWDVIQACPRLDFLILTKRAGRMRGLLRTVPTHSTGSIGSISSRTPIPNVWLGVSVENRKQGLPRIEVLQHTPAAVRFLSVEPLLEDLGPLDLSGIHWVIVGGESGPKARPMHPDWARRVRDQCLEQGVPFFFKQHGEWWPGSDYKLGQDRNKVLLLDGTVIDSGSISRWKAWDSPREHAVCISRCGKKKAGRDLDGRTWDEMPEARS